MSAQPWGLPTSVEVGGETFEIRTDYRVVLDAITVLNDAEIGNAERASMLLDIIYPESESIPLPCLKEAVERALWFIRGGSDERGKKQKLMDWSQDFQLIAAPVNRVLGYEVRSCDYLHWWSFLAAYYEIGDCLFAQVVSIRKKLKGGKKLDKQDRQFYRENRQLVDMRTPISEEEAALFEQWVV